MSVPEEFEAALEKGLARLSEDEWAIAQAQESILEPLAPHECFSSIAGILEIASRQDDPYCFSSCCWFALSLARKADTSELPVAANQYLPQLEAQARLLGSQAEHELASVYAWFRLPLTIGQR